MTTTTTTTTDKQVSTCAVNYYRNVFKPKSPVVVEALKTPITAPTLVVWGEEDKALGKELTIGLEKVATKLQLHYIPRCSHWVQMDEPEIVLEHMATFLESQGIVPTGSIKRKGAAV